MRRRIFLGIAVLAAALFLLNRDLFTYQYDFLGGRTFYPETDAKGEYFLTAEIPLKPGPYTFSYQGSFRGTGSSIFLKTEQGEYVAVEELSDGQESFSADFELNSLKSVRMGVNYDPEYSSLEIGKLQIKTEHILYRDSVLRHGVLSVVLILCFVLLVFCFAFPQHWAALFPMFASKESKFVFLFLTAVTAAVSAPFFHPGTYVKGEDLFFHLTRIEGMAESLKAGFFPVRNQLYWLKNYGYGAGYFYPDLFLYFPVGLRLMGFSLMSCYEIFVVTFTFFGLGSYYICTKSITKNRAAALSAVLLAAFSAYRLGSVYYRAALGEIQAFFLAPWIILGLYEIFHGRPQRWYIFAFGFFGMLSTHLISLVLAAGLTLVVCVFHVRSIFKDKRVFWALMGSALCVGGYGAYFLLPMWEQSQIGDLVINTLMSSVPGGVALRALSPWRNLFRLFYDWSYGDDFTRVVYPGWGFLALPLIRLGMALFSSDGCRGRSEALRFADRLLLLSFVLLFVSTDLFPWTVIQWLLNRIQFSWRLLLPFSVMLSVSGGVILGEIFREKNLPLCILTALILSLFSGFPILRHSFFDRTVPDDLFIMQDNRVCGGEYLPWKLSIEFVDKNGDTVLPDSDAAKITWRNREGLGFAFSWTASDGQDVTFRVPLIAYIGYQAVRTDENGIESPLSVGRSREGLVTVTSGGLPSGNIRVWYEKTTLQKIGEAASVFSLALSIAAVCVRKKRQVNEC